MAFDQTSRKHLNSKILLCSNPSVLAHLLWARGIYVEVHLAWSGPEGLVLAHLVGGWYWLLSWRRSAAPRL